MTSKDLTLYKTEDLWTKRVPEGEIGLEIETEGYNLPKEISPKYWTLHPDGSLRIPPARIDDLPGEAWEYVFARPLTRNETNLAIKNLISNVEKSNSEFIWSNRTSVHVHVNYLGEYLRTAILSYSLYTIFEDVFADWAGGKDRNGSLFCLGSRDAETSLHDLIRSLKNRDVNFFGSDNRYTACNLQSLRKFGSIEYRAMKGNIDPDFIKTWISTLLAIKDYSKSCDPDPRTLIQEFSTLGPRAFTEKVLGYSNATATVFSQANWRERIWEGMRLIQDLCYEVEWGDLKQHIKMMELRSKEVRPKRNTRVVNGIPVPSGLSSAYINQWSESVNTSFSIDWANIPAPTGVQ